MKFAVYCPGHGSHILLGRRSIEAVVNTETGILVHWRCRCGTRGILRTGVHAQGGVDEPPSRGPKAQATAA